MPTLRSSLTYRLRRLALSLVLLIGCLTALAGQASAGTLIPLVDMGGPGGGGGAAAVPAQYAGSANQRSIELTESKEAPAVAVAVSTDPSIDRIASRKPARVPATFDAGTSINYCNGCVRDTMA